MPFEELLKTPIKRFWFLHRHVDRIRAESDIRQLNLLGAVTAQDSFNKAHEDLRRSLGEIVVLEPVAPTLNLDPHQRDPEFDAAGMAALMLKHGVPKRKVTQD